MIVESTPSCLAENEPLYAKFDRAEADIVNNLPHVEMPIHHHFISSPHMKMYIREIFIPKGTLCTSQIHKEASPYTIVRGDVSIGKADGFQRVQGPFHGVNEVGVKRIIYTHEDTVWITFHLTEKTEVKEIAKDILFERDNPCLTPDQKADRWGPHSKQEVLT
jgi:hypothetical protein